MKNLFFVFLILSQNLAKSQNLVINGSIEESYDSCCTMLHKWEYWNLLDNYKNAPWIELFQAGSKKNEGTLKNSVGFQIPKDGTSYAGLGMYDKIDEVREYLIGSLSSPLKKGKKYKANLYISLADCSSYAINSIGVAFSTDSALKTISNHNLYLVSKITPSIEYFNSILNDTTNWVLISNSFVAKGGEDKIVIGCFKNDNDLFIEKKDRLKRIVNRLALNILHTILLIKYRWKNLSELKHYTYGTAIKYSRIMKLFVLAHRFPLTTFPAECLTARRYA